MAKLPALLKGNNINNTDIRHEKIIAKFSLFLIFFKFNFLKIFLKKKKINKKYLSRGGAVW